MKLYIFILLLFCPSLLLARLGEVDGFGQPCLSRLSGVIPSISVDLALVASNIGRELPAAKMQEVAGIYGKDDRIRRSGSEFPYNAMGKIEINSLKEDSSYHCTATMISSCHILSAGHCYLDDEGNPNLKNANFIFADGSSSSKIDKVKAGKAILKMIGVLPSFRSQLAGKADL